VVDRCAIFRFNGRAMFTNLLQLYTFVDQTMDRLRERFPAEIACGRGCADCCAAVFDVSFIEALFLLAYFRQLPKPDRLEILDHAETALAAWRKLTAGAGDLSTARIRCPLLTAANVCAAYPARPVNCRTYGVPTVINGAAHVCGLSGFDKGQTYFTIQLAPLQQSLLDYSCKLAGAVEGGRRFPSAEVLLHPAPFAAILAK